MLIPLLLHPFNPLRGDFLIYRHLRCLLPCVPILGWPHLPFLSAHYTSNLFSYSIIAFGVPCSLCRSLLADSPPCCRSSLLLPTSLLIVPMHQMLESVNLFHCVFVVPHHVHLSISFGLSTIFLTMLCHSSNIFISSSLLPSTTANNIFPSASFALIMFITKMTNSNFKRRVPVLGFSSLFQAPDSRWTRKPLAKKISSMYSQPLLDICQFCC